MTMHEILAQLRLCRFKDEMGHPLENNTAFRELEKMTGGKSAEVIMGDALIHFGYILHLCQEEESDPILTKKEHRRILATCDKMREYIKKVRKP